MATSLSDSDTRIAEHTTRKKANRPSDKLILTSITDTGEENRRNRCLSYKQQQEGKDQRRKRDKILHYYRERQTDRQTYTDTEVYLHPFMRGSGLSERERQTDRDRQTDRQTYTDTEVYLHPFMRGNGLSVR